MCQASFVSILFLGFNKMEASTQELADRKQEPGRGRLKRKDGREGRQEQQTCRKAVHSHSTLNAGSGLATYSPASCPPDLKPSWPGRCGGLFTASLMARIRWTVCQPTIRAKRTRQLRRAQAVYSFNQTRVEVFKGRLSVLNTHRF